MKHYTAKQWLAIALALCLWGVETWFLVDAAGYALTPAVAAIPAATAALAFIPLAFEELKGKPILASAMVVAALFLAAHVVSSVIERTGSTLDSKIVTAAATGESRDLLRTAIKQTETQLADASAKVRACKRDCDGIKNREKSYQNRLDKLRKELNGSAAPTVADPVGPRIADLTNGAISEHKAVLWRPLLLPFGCLVAIWALLGFGFGGHKPASVKIANDNPKDEDRIEVPDLEPTADETIVSWSKAFKAKHGRFPEQREIRSAFPEMARATVHRVVHRNQLAA